MDALKRSVEEAKAQRPGRSRRAKKDRLKPGMGSAARDHDVVIDRRLRRSFALICLVFLAFLPFFVLWLSDRGLSPSQIGVVLAAGALAAVIAAPFWSHVADRRAGSVRTLQGGIVVGRHPRDRARPHRMSSGHRGRCCGIGGRASPSNAVDGRARGLDPWSSLNEYGSFRLWAECRWGVGAIVLGLLFQRSGSGRCCPCTPWGSSCPPGTSVGSTRGDRFHGIPTLAFGSFGDALTHVASRFPSTYSACFVLGASTHAAWDSFPCGGQPGWRQRSAAGGMAAGA